MKTAISITLIVFMTLSTLKSQWTEVNSNTNNSITDISFVDSENGFISCGSSTILKTENGGLSWQTFDTGIETSFNSIFGIDKDTIYTCRISLYKSTNSCVSWKDWGGLDWGSPIFDIYFISPKTGFINKGRGLLKTNDYGLSWYAVSDSVYPGSKIVFPSADTGYVVGGSQRVSKKGSYEQPFYYGRIIKTTNGGENWHKLNFFNDTIKIVSASFVDNNFGYCFSNLNTIQKTEDGGLTWTLINTGINDLITDGLFINKETGFIITYNGKIYITTNGGQSWSLEHNSNTILTDIGNSGKVLVVGGANGLVCRRNIENINVSVNENNSDLPDILIYPNPVNSFITLQNTRIKNSYVSYTLTLNNMKGQEVLSRQVRFNDKYSLDLNNIDKGIYILTLINNNEKVIKKIVIH